MKKRTYSIVIWGYGMAYDRHFNQLKYFELKGDIEIVGITSSQNNIFSSTDGYPFISLSQLHQTPFDYIVIASNKKFQEIRNAAIEKGFDDDKLLPIKIFSLPYLDLNSYLQIKSSRLTIFSNTCWGGVIYKYLGLECLTPLRNLHLNSTDYLKFLNNPKEYLNAPLELVEISYDFTCKNEYPICRLKDIILHFNHYLTFDEAVEQWNRRINRINWDNLFIMMVTENQEDAEAFTKLSYRKKVCFVPFESDSDCLITIPPEIDKNVLFRVVPNRLIYGKYKYFELLELLKGNINSNRL